MIVVLPVIGPVFIVVSLRQALTGSIAGDTSGSLPPSAIRRDSLVFAAGLAMAFAATSAAWLALALPPRNTVERIVAAVLAGNFVSSLAFWPWLLITASINMGKLDNRRESPTER